MLSVNIVAAKLLQTHMTSSPSVGSSQPACWKSSGSTITAGPVMLLKFRTHDLHGKEPATEVASVSSPELQYYYALLKEQRQHDHPWACGVVEFEHT